MTGRPGGALVALACLTLAATGCAGNTMRAADVAPSGVAGEAPPDSGLSAPVGKEARSVGKSIAATERAILRNDWAVAKANVDEALAADPKSVRGLYYAGLCDEKFGKPREAESHYRQSLAEDATFPESAINLSALLIEAERAKEAVAVLLPVAKAWPSDLLLQENLGLAASFAKNHETAVRAFQRLDKAGALHRETRMTYADSLLALDRKPDALVVLRAGAREVGVEEAEIVPYVTLLVGAGAPEDAKDLIDRALKTARSATLLVLRAKAKLLLNDAKGAVADLEAATKLAPQDATTAFALAEARDVLGQRAEAKKAFTAALRLGLDGELAEKAKKRVEQLP